MNHPERGSQQSNTHHHGIHHFKGQFVKWYRCSQSRSSAAGECAIDNSPTHVPHGIMNASTHIATQEPVVAKDYTVLTTPSCPPCHGDILSALELEIMTLMRTEGWSRETAVRILLAKSSSESHSKAKASDQQQNPNNNNNNIMNNNSNNNNKNNNYQSAVKGALSHTNILSNDRHILGMKAAFPSTNNALSNAASHQLVVSEHQQQGKERGKVQWRQYQNHPMRGSQQSNSHHHHLHAAVEKASSSHTNRMFDHQPYIKETQKAPTNHHSVVAQEKQPHQHRVAQSQHQGVPSSSSSSLLVGFYQISGQGQGLGQGHRRGIPRSHARFAAAPDDSDDDDRDD